MPAPDHPTAPASETALQSSEKAAANCAYRLISQLRQPTSALSSLARKSAAPPVPMLERRQIRAVAF